MRETLRIINQLEQDGIIEKYAIGGAIAAIFYVEPFATHDVDIFFIVSSNEGLLNLSPLYSYLAGLGYEPDGEMVMIEGWPVQFLPVFNELLSEAMANVREVEYEGVPTRIFSPEYLIAIMLQLGRAKDYARAEMFIAQNLCDEKKMLELIQRHGIQKQWQELSRRMQ